MSDLAELISQWPIASFLRQSLWAYPVLNAFHIISIGLIIGSITTLDLRALGLFRAIPFVSLARPLARVAQTGVVLALLSGFLMFSVQPADYLSNQAFQLKLLFMALAILNALAVHQLPSWQQAINQNIVHPTLSATALLSLLLWILTIMAGRWIAFI